MFLQILFCLFLCIFSCHIIIVFNFSVHFFFYVYVLSFLFLFYYYFNLQIFVVVVSFAHYPYISPSFLITFTFNFSFNPIFRMCLVSIGPCPVLCVFLIVRYYLFCSFCFPLFLSSFIFSFSHFFPLFLLFNFFLISFDLCHSNYPPSLFFIFLILFHIPC